MKIKQCISISVSLSLILLPIPVQALPARQGVVNGTVSFDNTVLNTLSITASNKAIINYDKFNIGSNESVKFIQPSTDSIVLNRVIGANNPSSIIGSLSANGNIFLINPAGIIFGKDSHINTNSFLATTLDITDENFKNGEYTFSQKNDIPPSYILQKGEIKVSPTGFVVLAAPLVKSDGFIYAKAGNIHIGAVDNFSINFDGQKLVSFSYNPKDATKTDVLITQDIADEIINDVVNFEDVKNSIEIQTVDGVTKLIGGSGTALISSTLNTDATDDTQQAGKIDITSQRYTALLDGTIFSSNAFENGNGGVITVDSDVDTLSSARAMYKAKGGTISGDGGSISIDASNVLIFDGSFIDVSAEDGNSGTVSIIPTNLEITSDVSTNGDNYILRGSSITMFGTTISTIGSNQNDGNIEISANQIHLKKSQDGTKDTKLLAGTGSITLSAKSAKNAEITINDGTVISGGEVKIEAKAKAYSLFDSDYGNPYLKDITNIGDVFLDLPETPIAFQWVDTTSNIDIDSATITGSSIDVISKATSNVNISANFIVAALAYGKSEATAALNIDSGAFLTSTGDITLESLAKTYNKVTAKATNFYTKGSNLIRADKANIALSYTKTDTTATVNSDATINSDGKLTLNATGTKDISTSATAASYSAGLLGAAVAISDSTSNVDASLGGTVNVDSVKVVSDTVLKKIRTSSSAGVGNGFVYKKLLEQKADSKAITDKISSQTQEKTTDSKQGNQKIALSAAYTKSTHQNNASAKIAKNAAITTNGDIDILSNILIKNNDYDDSQHILGTNGIKSVAIATIDSTDNNPKENSLSGAVTLTDITNTSKAFIDDGADITTNGGGITVKSNTKSVYDLAWGDFANEVIDNKHDFGSLWDTILPEVTDAAGFRGKLFTSYAQSNAQGTKNAISGSVNIFEMNNNTDSYIGEGVTINAKENAQIGAISILADSDIAAINFAGVIGWTYFGAKAGNGIGGAYLDVKYGGHTKAYIAPTTNIFLTNLAVEANKNLNNFSMATAGGSGTNNLSGSFSKLTTNDVTSAYIDGATLTTANQLNNDEQTNLKVKAYNKTNFINGTGGLVKSKNTGIGAASSLNYTDRVTNAYISNSAISRVEKTLDGTYSISAENEGFIRGLALSGTVSTGKTVETNKEETKETDITKKASFGVTISGDSVINTLSDEANAYAENSIFKTGKESLHVLAKNSSDAFTYSGAAALNFSKSSVGLAGAYARNNFYNKSNAYILNTALDISSVNLEALNSGDAWSLTGSGSGGTGYANLAGSVAITEINNKTKAHVTDSYLTLDNGLSASATDDIAVKSFAGAIVATKTLGIGASYTQNDITNTIEAYIKNSSLTSDTLSLKALQTDNINNIVGVDELALNGMAISSSTTQNTLNSTLASYIYGNDQNDNHIQVGNDIEITAKDTTSMNVIAGALSVASSAGVGASVVNNQYKNTIQTYIDNSADISGKNIFLNSISDKNIIASAVGGTGAGTVSAVGTVLINNFDEGIDSYIKDTTIKATDSMTVHAIEQNDITTYGGTISGAGTVGIGGTVIHSNLKNQITAKIEQSTVDIGGNGASITIPDKNYFDYETTKSFYGIDVLALANEEIKSYTANLSGAGTVAIAAASNYTTIENTLNSYIDNSRINQDDIGDLNPYTLQSVFTRAIANNNLKIYGGGGAGAGNVGIGGALNVNTIKNKTNSYVYNSSVTAQNLVEARAQSYENILSDVVSGAGAGTGVSMAGSVSITNILNTNEAKIDEKSDLKSNSDITVLAKDKSYLDISAGVGSGAAMGVGGSVAINNIKNNSLAHIDNSATNAKGKTDLLAYDYANLASQAKSGSLGAFGGSGAVVMNTVDSTTKAYTHKDIGEHILINQNNNFVNNNQEVEINAQDYVKVDDTLGSSSIGGLGVGGSISVTNLKNDTDAYIGEASLLYAKKDINVLAKSTKNFTSNVQAYAGGSAGVSGSVVVANIGKSFDNDAITAFKNTQIIFNNIINTIGLDESTYKFTPSTIYNKSYAHIDDYAQVNVGGTLNTTSENTIENLSIFSGAGGYGANLGVGGASSLVYLDTNNKVYTGNGVNINANIFNINAQYKAGTVDKQLLMKTYAGGAGMVGLGADYTKFTHTYLNNALVGATNYIVANDKIGIFSPMDENIKIYSFGASAGAGVGGLSKALINSSGDTMASIGQSSKLYADSGNIDLISSYDTHMDSYASTAALGFYGATGTESNIEINPNVKSLVSDNSWLETGSGDVNIKTLFYNNLYSQAKGFSLGSMNVGMSYARSYNRDEVSSLIGNNVIINAGNDFNMLTYENRYVDTGDKIDSREVVASANSAAGTMIGGVGSKAVTSNHSHLKTTVGDSSKINAKDDIIIKTKSYAKTDSLSNGKSISGIAGAGFTGSYSYNDGDTLIDIGNLSSLIAKDDIVINAYAKKNTYANAYGGIGGLLNGSGTSTKVWLGNNIDINIQDGAHLYSIDLDAGDIDILATGNMYTNIYAKTSSAGLITANSVKSEIDMDGKNNDGYTDKKNQQSVNIDIGKKAEILANNVDIISSVEQMSASSEAYSKTYAYDSYSRSYAYLTTLSELGININDDAFIIGYNSLDIKAHQHTDDVFARTTATTTISPSVVGKLYATVKNNPTFKSDIEIKKGVILSSDGDKLVIEGSSPNMKKVKYYPNSYNYVKYPHIINKSIAGIVFHKSFSTATKEGYFRSQKTIDKDDSVHVYQTPTDFLSTYEYQFTATQDRSFNAWSPKLTNGILSDSITGSLVDENTIGNLNSPVATSYTLPNIPVPATPPGGGTSSSTYTVVEIPNPVTPSSGGTYTPLVIADPVTPPVVEVPTVEQNNVEFIAEVNENAIIEELPDTGYDIADIPDEVETIIEEGYKEPTITTYYPVIENVISQTKILDVQKVDKIPGISQNILSESNLNLKEILGKSQNYNVVLVDNKILGGKLLNNYIDIINSGTSSITPSVMPSISTSGMATQAQVESLITTTVDSTQSTEQGDKENQ